MKTAIAILSFVLAGPGLLTLGIWSLRSRAWHDRIPLAEYLIDRTVGVEIPPRTASDRGFARVQAWFCVVFGSFFSLVLAAIIFSLFA